MTQADSVVVYGPDGDVKILPLLDAKAMRTPTMIDSKPISISPSINYENEAMIKLPHKEMDVEPKKKS